MIYSFKYEQAVLEFAGNCCRAIVTAPDQATAISTVRRLFEFQRQTTAHRLPDSQFKVEFKVSTDYRPRVLVRVGRMVKRIRQLQHYETGSPLEQYVITAILDITGKPEWLQIADIKEEIRTLRQATVVARDLRNMSEFFDWDICIHNFVDLNYRQWLGSSSRRNILG